MAYEKSKGLVAIATDFNVDKYTYTNITKYIAPNNCTITPDMIQDLDSYRNANGYLKRTTLPYKATKIDFNTMYLKYEQKCEFMSILRRGWSLNDGKCVASQQKLRVRVYNDKKDDYDHIYCYVPDLEFQYYSTYDGKPIYLPIRVALIDYGHK